MTRAIPLASFCVMALFGALASATAAPLPTASKSQVNALAQAIDYRRCYWDDGERVCRTYYDDEDDDYGDDGPDYDGYGPPGVYLGYGGIGYDYAPEGPPVRFYGGPGVYVHH